MGAPLSKYGRTSFSVIACFNALVYCRVTQSAQSPTHSIKPMRGFFKQYWLLVVFLFLDFVSFNHRAVINTRSPEASSAVFVSNST
jgi:hypothetical protein